jgi:hypothetical protein
LRAAALGPKKEATYCQCNADLANQWSGWEKSLNGDNSK